MRPFAYMCRRRWTNRLTVEDVPLSLCVGECHIDGVFVSPVGASWMVYLFDRYDALLGSIEYTLTQTVSQDLAIHIRGQFLNNITPVDEQTIPVTTVRPPLGGKRFWLLCGCGRRIGRLYLPSGQRIFRCRYCYNLTYRSAQRHDRRIYGLARDLVALRAALRSGNRKEVLPGLRVALVACRRRSTR